MLPGLEGVHWIGPGSAGVVRGVAVWRPRSRHPSQSVASRVHTCVSSRSCHLASGRSDRLCSHYPILEDGIRLLARDGVFLFPERLS